MIQEIPSKRSGFSKTLSKDGIHVPIDLNVLIDKVYVAPACPKWLFHLVKSLTKKYGLHKEVCQSILDDKPIH